MAACLAAAGKACQACCRVTVKGLIWFYQNVIRRFFLAWFVWAIGFYINTLFMLAMAVGSFYLLLIDFECSVNEPAIPDGFEKCLDAWSYGTEGLQDINPDHNKWLGRGALMMIQLSFLLLFYMILDTLMYQCMFEVTVSKMFDRMLMCIILFATNAIALGLIVSVEIDDGQYYEREHNGLLLASGLVVFSLATLIRSVIRYLTSSNDGQVEFQAKHDGELYPILGSRSV